MVWFVLAACAVIAAVWPLFRASAAVNADSAANSRKSGATSSAASCRRARRKAPAPEAARRLIAAASGPSPAPPSRRARLGAAALIAPSGCRRSPFPSTVSSASRACPTSRWRAAGLGRMARTTSSRRSPRSRRGSPPSLTTARAGHRPGLHAARALFRRRARLCRGRCVCSVKTPRPDGRPDLPPFAALQGKPRARAGSARKRSSACDRAVVAALRFQFGDRISEEAQMGHDDVPCSRPANSSWWITFTLVAGKRWSPDPGRLW